MQNATPPDVDLLIVGGETPRRRRHATLAGGTAVALLLIGGGAYAGTHLDAGKPEASGITGEPTTTAEPTTGSEPTGAVTEPPSLPAEQAGRTIEPGTYRLLVGFDRSGAQIDADLTFGTRDWRDGNFPIVRVGEFVGGVGVYQPHGLAGGSGCSGDRLDTDLGRGGFGIPRELADLPRSKVLQPLTRVRAFGHDASHVRLRIKDDCPAGQGYRVAETARGTRGISYSDVPTRVTVDFWVVDVGTTSVVVDAWHQRGSSADLVNQIAEVRDSITLVPADVR